MDVAGALLPFTQVVRPELTIHVQEVLTQAERETDSKLKIPEINEPEKYEDDLKSPKSDTNNGNGNPAWWLLVVLPHGKKHVHFEANDKIYYF